MHCLGCTRSEATLCRNAKCLRNGKIQLVHDLYGLSLRLEALECDGKVLGLDLLRTSQTPEEVHVPEGTAILAVSDSVQTDILFLLYQTGDLGIFDLGQFFSGNFAGFKLAASFVDNLCAQGSCRQYHNDKEAGFFHGGCPSDLCNESGSFIL